MIFDHIDKADLYYSVHPKFKSAFELLRSLDQLDLKLGVHEIDERKMFLIISDGEIAPPEIVKMEVHRRYIDIQFVVSGKDKIGYRYLNECKKRLTEFDVENDYELYGDDSESYLEVTDNKFVIFFPDDAHAPLLSTGRLKKVVVKVEI